MMLIPLALAAVLAWFAFGKWGIIGAVVAGIGGLFIAKAVV